MKFFILKRNISVEIILLFLSLEKFNFNYFCLHLFIFKAFLIDQRK